MRDTPVLSVARKRALRSRIRQHTSGSGTQRPRCRSSSRLVFACNGSPMDSPWLRKMKLATSTSGFFRVHIGAWSPSTWFDLEQNVSRVDLTLHKMPPHRRPHQLMRKEREADRQPTVREETRLTYSGRLSVRRTRSAIARHSSPRTVATVGMIVSKYPFRRRWNRLVAAMVSMRTETPGSFVQVSATRPSADGSNSK